MYKKDKKLLSEVNSFCERLDGLEKEARSKDSEVKFRTSEEKGLADKIEKLRKDESSHERKFRMKMEEVEASNAQSSENYLTGTESLRIEREVHMGLLKASKNELEIIKTEVKKLKEFRLNLTKEMEMESLNTKDNDGGEDEDERPTELGLETLSDSVEMVKQSLPELEKKSEKLVWEVTSCEQNLRGKIEILGDNLRKITKYKKGLKDIEEKKESRSLKSKESKRIVPKEAEAVTTRAPREVEVDKELEERNSSLDELIRERELEYKTALRKIDELVNSQSFIEKLGLKHQKVEKIFNLSARLNQLRKEMVIQGKQ